MSDQGPYPAPGQQPEQPTVAPPPPGYQAPQQPPPSYYPPQQPPPGYYPPQPYGQAPPGYYQPPPMLMPAHKPGALPLRPLRLGDIYDGAFKIIRFNPGATVGSAVLVTAVAMAIPVLVTGVLISVIDFSSTLSDSNGDGSNPTLGIGSLLQLIGLIFVTGMIAHVVSAAAVGARLTLTQAWAATRGKRWKLIGMTFLLYGGMLLYSAAVIGLIVLMAVTLAQTTAIILSVLLGLAGIVGLVFFWIRVYYLAVPPLMLEDIGIFAALRRSWGLTSHQYWRTFGIAALTSLITNIAGGLLGTPFVIVGAVIAFSTDQGDSALLALVITNAVATVASSAFVAPFAASVTSIQYIDQRIRKEGYDVELLTRAGITGP